MMNDKILNSNEKIRLNKFMVKFVIKNSELSGYTWVNNKASNLECYIEVKALTLKDAIEYTKLKYGDKDKYWVKADGSYMVLE